MVARGFFEHGAMDVIIVDVSWNGPGPSRKVASMADAYEVNVARHNFYSHLATMMSAHLCAIVPNLRIMEFDTDQPPWMDELVTVKPEIQNGYPRLPTGPGWGTEVNEAAVRAHPPRSARELAHQQLDRALTGKADAGGGCAGLPFAGRPGE